MENNQSFEEIQLSEKLRINGVRAFKYKNAHDLGFLDGTFLIVQNDKSNNFSALPENGLIQLLEGMLDDKGKLNLI